MEEEYRDKSNEAVEPRPMPSDGLRQARALQKSASSYIRKKHLIEARPLLERALEIYSDLNVLDTRIALCASYKLARLDMLLGNDEAARAVISTVLERTHAPAGPVFEFRFQMALAQVISDKKVAVFDFFKDSSDGSSDGSKERNNYLRVFDCLQNYAAICRNTGDYSQADVALQEAQRYKHLENFFPEDIFVATLCA